MNVDDGGTWHDDSEPADTPLVDYRTADGETPRPGVTAPISGRERARQRRHYRKLRYWTLAGLGLIFLATLAVVFFGPATHSITESFADRLATLIFPTVMSAAATIVGTLFSDSGDDQ